MEPQGIGTINGKPITQEMLDSYTATFERDWDPSEFKVVPVKRGHASRRMTEEEAELLDDFVTNNPPKVDPSKARFSIPITIDRKSLTIMGVPFPDIETLETVADAIGTNMFEGFQPTREGIKIIRDYCLGKITFEQVTEMAKKKEYEGVQPEC